MLHFIFRNTEDFAKLLSNKDFKRQYISDVYFQKFVCTLQGTKRLGVLPQ